MPLPRPGRPSSPASQHRFKERQGRVKCAQKRTSEESPGAGAGVETRRMSAQAMRSAPLSAAWITIDLPCRSASVAAEYDMGSLAVPTEIGPRMPDRSPL